MSSFSTRKLALAALLSALPLGSAAQAADNMARAIYNQAEGVEQGIRYAARLSLIDAAKAGQLGSEARAIRNRAAHGDGSRQLLAELSTVSQSLRYATGEAWRIGGGGDGGYYPAGYDSNFPSH